MSSETQKERLHLREAFSAGIIPFYANLIALMSTLLLLLLLLLLSPTTLSLPSSSSFLRIHLSALSTPHIHCYRIQILFILCLSSAISTEILFFFQTKQRTQKFVYAVHLAKGRKKIKPRIFLQDPLIPTLPPPLLEQATTRPILTTSATPLPYR